MRGLQPKLNRDGIDLLLVSIHEPTGQVLTERYNFQLSPTFIIFDGAGHELWRGSRAPSLEQARQITGSTGG